MNSQLEDYKKDFNGHLENTSERDQEIEFLREGNAAVAREKIEEISCSEGKRIVLVREFPDPRIHRRGGRERSRRGNTETTLGTVGPHRGITELQRESEIQLGSQVPELEVGV